MESILLQLGLSDKEVSLYLLLLKQPHQTANELAAQTDIKRTNVYRLLDGLEEKGLIISDASPVKKFTAAEPQALQKIIHDKQAELKQAANSLSTAMPALRSQYALSLDKPGVFHMAGPEGFERSLIDMIRSKTEVLLIASDDIPNDEATLKRFRELLLERKKMGVRTRALFHHCDYEDRIKKEFTERGMQVRFIGATPFKGEVVIYEDNAVFGVYDPSIVLTVITNVHIANTMRTVFEELWAAAE